jgi:hypothetical protein
MVLLRLIFLYAFVRLERPIKPLFQKSLRRGSFKAWRLKLLKDFPASQLPGFLAIGHS